MSKILRKSNIGDQSQEITVRRCFQTVTGVRRKNADEDDMVKLQQKKQQLQAEIEVMLAEAKKQAEQIVAEARAEKEAVLAEAREYGFQQGYEEGLAAGKEEAQKLRREAEEVLQQARMWYRQTVAENEEKIIDLAVAIASKLLHVQLELSPQQINIIAQEALQKVRGGKNYVIYAHPRDAEILRSHKDMLLQDLPEEISLRVIADKGLTPGGCLVDTEEGQIEVTIEGQLDRVKQVLLGREQSDS